MNGDYVQVSCSKYPESLGPSTRNVGVSQGVTADDLKNLCAAAFGLPELSRAHGPLQVAVVDAQDEELQGDPAAVIAKARSGLRVAVSRLTRLHIAANENVDGEVRPFEHDIENVPIPLFGPLPPPLKLWEWATGQLAEQQRAQISVYSAFACELENAGTRETRPADSGQSLYDLRVTPADQLTLSPCLEITVNSAAGPSSPIPVSLRRTWGQFREMLIQSLPPGFFSVSGVAHLRLNGSWMLDLNRPILADIASPPADLWLHPIVSCAVIAIAEGKLFQFLARMPADRPVGDLLPDLVNRFEGLFGVPFAGETKPGLVCLTPPSYQKSLSEGRMFIAPTSSLADVGVRNGYAVLLLLQNNTLPGIIDLPSQGPASVSEPVTAPPEPAASSAPEPT